MKNLEVVQNKFLNEVRAATLAFYTWKSINEIAHLNKSIRIGMNKEPLFWNTVLNSLQTAIFITLGRIFDLDKGALSIHTFISKCISFVEQFDLHHLRQRKIRSSNGQPTPWLDNYLKDANVLSIHDLRELKRESKKYQKLYEEIYKPIRTKIFAHLDIATMDKVDEMFANTKIADIQNMLEFLNQLSEVVWQFKHNGRRSELSDYDLKLESEVKKNVESILNRIAV